MVQANQGNTVKVHYTGKLDDGTVFDTSDGRDPLEFTIGQGQLIPGFEDGVLGMEPGESKTVRVPSDQAYGPHKPEGVLSVSRSNLPEDMEVEPGMMVQGTQPDGRTMAFTVVDVGSEEVTLDGNHPLAGKDLTFDIQVVEVT